MELLPFQLEASKQIAVRFHRYMSDPLAVKRDTIVPFYQNLSAITGAGKTLILADAVEQIRELLPIEPIVLWISKGRVLVWQTLNNLATGKYAALTAGYDVKPLGECTPSDVEDAERGLLLVATVGKFNQRDKEEGGRKIFTVALDQAGQSLWEMLKSRRDRERHRRPLLIVYDEGHNLSNQQTQLLMELGPDAIIAASATLRVPEALSSTIDRLRKDARWRDEEFVTAVPTSQVVKSGLVVMRTELVGLITPMEQAIDDLIGDFMTAEVAARKANAGFQPKAIYVSSTNTVDDSTIKEDLARPFEMRKARPILIWRYLVEKKGINPDEIAVYCNLQFDARYAPPLSFHLFAGGDSDYDRFMSGQFRHIIFNLALQEGWDDPACSFAYIDKSMGSADQVTQVVGRVLRQPEAHHFPASVLNTAYFYIRTDEKGVIERILEEVARKLAEDVLEIDIVVRKSKDGRERKTLPVLKARSVPVISVNSSAALEPIQKIISGMMDYRKDEVNTVGAGSKIRVLQTIGDESTSRVEWVEVDHSNPVTARSIFCREVQRQNPKALTLCDIELPKFDAAVEYNSVAAQHIRDTATRVVDAYIEHSEIVQNSLDDPYEIADIPIDETKVVRFKNSLHEGYSGLNGFEKEYAKALDSTKRVWCRNPAQGAYGIPLVDRGSTKTFNPDFLVWSGKQIISIDTKGDHLIVEDSGRKLFHIHQIGPGLSPVIKMVTQGKWWVRENGVGKTSGSAGYTLWSLKQGKVQAQHCDTAGEVARLAVQPLTQQRPRPAKKTKLKRN